MNGAQAVIRTLVGAGVKVCFANPGTSEMHFVGALDAVEDLRAVLVLFEGVATAAADGYARMSDTPAAALLHLGPGLANGLANLHNARRARVPLVAIVGDHATYHKRWDAPLDSNIEYLARNVAGFFRSSRNARNAGRDVADAVAASWGPPGQVAVLVLPADVSWTDGATVAPPRAARPMPRGIPAIDEVSVVLRSGEPTLLLLGGRAVREHGLRAASRISVATGAKLMHETFPPRVERGANLPAIERLPYLPEQAIEKLEPYRHVVLVDTEEPVCFFAYPGKQSELVPREARLYSLAAGSDDPVAALVALAERVCDSSHECRLQPAHVPDRPSGPLSLESLAAAIAATLPADAIIVDESNTSGRHIAQLTAGAPRHDWLYVTGGAIGHGMPMAIGAAVACPRRKVLCLEADGSAMYTPQALWTMARERLDITTVLFNNGAYAILRRELQRVGAGPAGTKAQSLMVLTDPTIDYVNLALSLGVHAVRATSADALSTELAQAFAKPGPHLIEAVVPSAW